MHAKTQSSFGRIEPESLVSLDRVVVLDGFQVSRRNHSSRPLLHLLPARPAMVGFRHAQDAMEALRRIKGIVLQLRSGQDVTEGRDVTDEQGVQPKG
jgi:hypothetical protein